MKKILSDTQKMMAAITFAEAGEWNTAREMMPEPRDRHEVGWLEKNFAAVAFAEAGEWSTAREMIPEPQYGRKLSWLERVFAAVAFAEENLSEMALQTIDGTSGTTTGRKDRLAEDLGLPGFHLAYGYVSFD